MWDPMLGDDPATRKQNMQALVKDCPMKRFGKTNEVASLAVLLASDEAAYMNGTELTIDGGLLAGSAASPAAQE
jgi:NAD(P)-dependent dehydrogenase (short-subunit alcohol dehydrogenase family)